MYLRYYSGCKYLAYKFEDATRVASKKSERTPPMPNKWGGGKPLEKEESSKSQEGKTSNVLSSVLKDPYEVMRPAIIRGGRRTSALGS